MSKTNKLTLLLELSIIPALALCFWVWGSEFDWELDKISALTLFPLFGLIAFVTMWWHMLLGFARRLNPKIKKYKTLHNLSAIWVFVSLLLHPALMLYWGFQKNIGSHVEIYQAYVGEDALFFVLLGYMALAGFLLFDLGRVLARNSFIKKQRETLEDVSDIAFIIVFIHSLNLGQHTEEGWFRVYWLILGLSGILFIIQRQIWLHRHGRKANTSEKAQD